LFFVGGIEAEENEADTEKRTGRRIAYSKTTLAKQISTAKQLTEKLESQQEFLPSTFYLSTNQIPP
jgi:hypothetical protein